MDRCQSKQTVYTLRYRVGERGTVLITRQALQLAGLRADRCIVPAFTTVAGAMDFRDGVRDYLAGPVDIRRWPLGQLAIRCLFAGHKLRIDPHVEFV